jgi:hypothetical protein
MDIELGEFQLVHSATIIEIPDEIEGDFTFLIYFINDPSSKDSTTNLKDINNFCLQIEFVNFENFQGGGNNEVIHVGTLRNVPLYINYRVFDLTTIGKTLIINFYTKK